MSGDGDDPSSYAASEWVILWAYIILGIIGAVGNGFIIYVVWQHKNMRTTTFYLLANQALSDGACGLLYLSLWFFCSANMLESSAGHVTCEIMYTFKVATFFVSVLTMMTISVERYVKLYHIQSQGLNPRWSITLTWIGGMAISVLCMFHFRVARFFTHDRLVGCRIAYEVSDIPFFEKHYNFLLVVILGCGVPLSITGYNYWKVVQKIRSRPEIVGAGATLTPSANVNLTANQKRAKRNKRKTIEMLIVIVIVYCILCFPLYSAYLINSFVTPILPDHCDATTQEPAFFLVAYFLAVFSICINPVIYCYYKKEFRTELKRVINTICRRQMFKVIGEDSMAAEDTTLHSGATTVPTSASMAFGVTTRNGNNDNDSRDLGHEIGNKVEPQRSSMYQVKE